jgi:hypothetical protein
VVFSAQTQDYYKNGTLVSDWESSDYIAYTQPLIKSYTAAQAKSAAVT